MLLGQHVFKPSAPQALCAHCEPHGGADALKNPSLDAAMSQESRSCIAAACEIAFGALSAI